MHREPAEDCSGSHRFCDRDFHHKRTERPGPDRGSHNENSCEASLCVKPQCAQSRVFSLDPVAPVLVGAARRLYPPLPYVDAPDWHQLLPAGAHKDQQSPPGWHGKGLSRAGSVPTEPCRAFAIPFSGKNHAMVVIAPIQLGLPE